MLIKRVSSVSSRFQKCWQ